MVKLWPSGAGFFDLLMDARVVQDNAIIEKELHLLGEQSIQWKRKNKIDASRFPIFLLDWLNKRNGNFLQFRILLRQNVNAGSPVYLSIIESLPLLRDHNLYEKYHCCEIVHTFPASCCRMQRALVLKGIIPTHDNSTIIPALHSAPIVSLP